MSNRIISLKLIYPSLPCENPAKECTNGKPGNTVLSLYKFKKIFTFTFCIDCEIAYGIDAIEDFAIKEHKEKLKAKRKWANSPEAKVERARQKLWKVWLKENPTIIKQDMSDPKNKVGLGENTGNYFDSLEEAYREGFFKEDKE